MHTLQHICMCIYMCVTSVYLHMYVYVYIIYMWIYVCYVYMSALHERGISAKQKHTCVYIYICICNTHIIYRLILIHIPYQGPRIVSPIEQLLHLADIDKY